MASCLENLKNLEMSGNLTDVRELSGKTVCANRTSGSTRWPKKRPELIAWNYTTE